MTISSAASRWKRAALLLCAVVAPLFLTSVTQVSASATGDAYDAALKRPVSIAIPQSRAGVLGGFRIHNYNASGKCIGIANGLAGDWDCTSNPDQDWHWGYPIAPGWRELVNGNGQCLAVNGASTSAGARILGYECVKSEDQYWATEDSPVAGQSYLVNYKARFSRSATGRIVGVAGASTANGAPLVLWPAEGHPDQFWS